MGRAPDAIKVWWHVIVKEDEDIILKELSVLAIDKKAAIKYLIDKHADLIEKSTIIIVYIDNEDI